MGTPRGLNPSRQNQYPEHYQCATETHLKCREIYHLQYTHKRTHTNTHTNNHTHTHIHTPSHTHSNTHSHPHTFTQNWEYYFNWSFNNLCDERDSNLEPFEQQYSDQNVFKIYGNTEDWTPDHSTSNQITNNMPLKLILCAGRYITHTLSLSHTHNIISTEVAITASEKKSKNLKKNCSFLC